MERLRFMVTGPKIVSLVQDVQQQVGDHYVLVDDPMVVMVTETPCNLGDSNLQTTLIFAFQDRTICDLEILIGGGDQPLCLTDRSAELRSLLRELCAYRSWLLSERVG